MMTTADMSMKVDPVYREISERFHANPHQFADAFARAWFKLLHRDMGPRVRYLGPDVPAEVLVWQDPVPTLGHVLIDAEDVVALKARILGAALSVSELVSTAWASASTYRATDKRGGANGARIRLAPMAAWDVNVQSGVRQTIGRLEELKEAFDTNRSDGKKVSLADLIVLGGVVAVEAAATAAGHDITVPFNSGRTDAEQEMTEVGSIAYLEPKADGFRNYLQKGAVVAPEHLLVDKAFTLNLSAPEMTALVGGLRVLGGNGGDTRGVLTDRPGQLTNDFFVNLLHMSVTWRPSDETESVFVAVDRSTGATRWTATRVDLVFGSNSELRAVAEVYAQVGGAKRFLDEFVTAWVKVMNNDRFDLQ